MTDSGPTTDLRSDSWYDAVAVDGDWVQVTVRTPDGEVAVYRVPQRSLFDTRVRTKQGGVRRGKPALDPARTGRTDREHWLRELTRSAI